MASIAFCLEHDEKFKKAFLCNFCGISFAGRIPKIHIAADDHKWGDLVIRGNDKSFVCVLEFKIGSKVEDHQDPNLPDFKYGKEICHDSNCGICKEKIFIVVTHDDKKKTIDQNMRDGVRYDWKSWTDFWNAMRHCDHERGLSSDLFDCLGDFGITVFRERQLRNPNMKLENSAFQALKVIQILQAVYCSLGYRQLRISDIDDSDPDEETWQTGVYVWNEERDELKSWFGYLGNKKNFESGRCEIHFYDASYNLEEIGQKLQKHGIEFSNEKDGENYTVFVKCPTTIQKSNLDWFESVYKAVGAIKL